MADSSAFSSRELLDMYLSMDRELDATTITTEAQTVAAVTALAVRDVPGVEQASISDRRRGEFRTLGATGQMAAAADTIQYDVGSGPCVDAIIDNTVYCTGDIAGDTRWPTFGARAHAETRVGSMLSFRLFFEEEPERIAGLNLYSTRGHAFDDTSEMIGTVLATHSARVLTAAAARDKAAHLTLALDSNRRIGAAMGILMAAHKVTDTDAFNLLRIASQTSNRKLTDIADEVLTTGMLELPASTASRNRPAP